MKGRDRSSKTQREQLLSGRGVAYLASQVGAHSSRLWSERLLETGLESRGVMLIWNVAITEGRSQRELAVALGLPASRVVDLVDALEARGWLERRAKAGDRRTHQLFLTDTGHELFNRIMEIAAVHEEEFTKGLEPQERAALEELLGKLAAKQGLTARTHPDF